MQLRTRKVVDRAFTGLGVFSIGLVAATLIVLLGPIVVRGLGAFFFSATIEHRRVQLDVFGHGDATAIDGEWIAVQAARQPVYDAMTAFENQLETQFRGRERREYRELYAEFKDALRELFGPLPGEKEPQLLRNQYGPTRWDRAQVKAHHVLYREEWDYSDPTKMGVAIDVPRIDDFRGTALEPAFAYLAQPANLQATMAPQFTFYWRFLTNDSEDAHFFGGIWGEVLGTLYLTIGAILFAVPMGVISAIYLVEYAGENWVISMLRTCISTLAGVPSIVFGLFGLAFFINTMHVSQSPSVLAGSLTLALLILPVVIRASEEAIKAVPHTYKEAALSVGASRWRTIVTVILPAALPGILTGIVISMGRAAGETAPIIFTAAVAAYHVITPVETLTHPTRALPWGVYNLCSEHPEAGELRHVQYGMVLTLVALVLMLNGAAIIMRARIARKLTG